MRIQDEIHLIKVDMKNIFEILEDTLARITIIESVVFEKVKEKEKLVKFRPTETAPS